MPSPYPPSGIIRNYGVNFFIYKSGQYPIRFVVANSNQLSDPPQWEYVPFPSQGLLDYADYFLGAGTVTFISMDDCMTDSFTAGNNGSGGAFTLPA